MLENTTAIMAIKNVNCGHACKVVRETHVLATVFSKSNLLQFIF